MANRNGWKNVLDQIAHAIYAVGVIAPAALWPSLWTFMLSGFVLGFIRELNQYLGPDRRVLMLSDRTLDVASFVIAAGLLWIVTQ